MVTQLLGALTFDLLSATNTSSFFEDSAAKRKNHIEGVLGKTYPEPLRTYVQNATNKTFVSDAEGILSLLGDKLSVIAEARRFVREKNTLILSLLDTLAHLHEYESSKTQLGKILASFREAGANYQNILTRELQSLLLEARDEDSPVVQIAIQTDLRTKDLPGVPSISVQHALLGGSRLFYNGQVADRSWRARLTKVLSAVSKV